MAYLPGNMLWVWTLWEVSQIMEWESSLLWSYDMHNPGPSDTTALTMTVCILPSEGPPCSSRLLMCGPVPLLEDLATRC